MVDPPKDEGPKVERDEGLTTEEVPTTKSSTDAFESTRITGFLMFEFALLFGILAFVNYQTVPQLAAQVLGPGLIIAFIAILLLAPLLFAYMTLLSDEITAALGLDNSSSREQLHEKPQTGDDLPKNMWLRSSIAVVMGLAIGTGIVIAALAAFTEKFYY